VKAIHNVGKNAREVAADELGKSFETFEARKYFRVQKWQQLLSLQMLKGTTVRSMNDEGPQAESVPR
jgi:hypothetical protein